MKMADGTIQNSSYYSLQSNHLRMSMRDKSLLKRRVNKEHSSNFRAGYVHVNEEHLHKTGLRGRKRYVFYAFLVLLLLMVLGNLAVTIVIFTLLRISHTGVADMEFISPGLVLRFLTDADMGTLLINGTSRVTSFQDLAISGENQPIHMMVTGNVSSVNVLPNVTRIVVKDVFKIIDPQTGEVLFTTDFNEKGISHPFKHMETAETVTNKISSAVDQDLNIESSSSLTLSGAQYLTAEGKSFDATAGRDIVLNSTKGNIILEGKEGIYLAKVNNFLYPRQGDPGVITYKLCVCTPSGKLFRVPVTQPGFGCANANEFKNPCEN